MSSFDAVLASATQHLRNNQLAETEALCRSVLGQASDHPEALHLLGLAKLRGGDTTQAVAYLGRAAAAAPDNAAYWNNLGYACVEAGRPREAADACARALRLAPHYPDAHNNLGLAYEQLGDLDRAGQCYRQALAGRPDFAEAHNNLGNVFQGQDKLDEATASYQRALQLRPAFPKALNNLGTVWAAQGDFKKAATFYRQAVQLWPDYHEAWTNLGIVHRDQENFQEAIQCFGRALALRPDSADAHVHLGAALEKRGDCQSAEALFREALVLRPDHAGASTCLASVLDEQGRFDMALTQWRQTLRLQPDLGSAYFHLGELAAHGYGCFGPEDIARLTSLVRSGQGSPTDRSHYFFTLATALDRQGRFDEAFFYYRAANDLRRCLAQKQGRGFDIRKLQAQVDQAIAVFDAEFFCRAKGWGSDSQMPIFVVGMPRSGSTLAMQILSSDPQVSGAGEIQVFPQLLAALTDRAGSLHVLGCVVKDRADARDLANTYLANITALGRGAARVVDKTLSNFLHLGLLAALFPRAPIIHCRRDPRDLCLSCYFQNFNDMNFSWSLEDLAAFHREYERAMDHWRRVLPTPLFDLQYEELVQDQESITRRLVAFCGLSWNSRFLTFYENPRAVQTASLFQVRKPMSPKSVGRWKNYQSHLQPLLDALLQ